MRYQEAKNKKGQSLEYLIQSDDQFVYEMFFDEFVNNHYHLSFSYEDTLKSCGFTLDDIMYDDRLRRLFFLAEHDYLRSMHCF